MLKVSGQGVHSSVSDWKFISSAVKAIFCMLQILQVRGELKSSPNQEAWACISTIKLHEALSDDVNNHEIVVNELYAHIQRNVVLKVDFNYQMVEMPKRVKAAKNNQVSA